MLRIHHKLFALVWRIPRVSSHLVVNLKAEPDEDSYDNVVAGLPARLRSTHQSLGAGSARRSSPGPG